MNEGPRALWQGGGLGEDAGTSYDAAAAAIAARFRMQLASLRRRMRSSEMPAAVRALHDEKETALRSLRERRDIDRFAARMARRLARAPPPPKPM